jgi:hypothetical protein
MALLKYTTEIEASRSIGEIMGILTEMDARSITVTYSGQSRTPTALEFKVETVYGERAFRLPARIDAVFDTLKAQHATTKARTKQGPPTRKHAANVAWRILKTWADVQLALVQIGMATTDEIMLPYMLVSAERTVYEDYAERQQALPPGSR